MVEKFHRFRSSVQLLAVSLRYENERRTIFDYKDRHSCHVMTTMVPILSEIYWRGSLALFMIYFPYFFVPLMLHC